MPGRVRVGFCLFILLAVLHVAVGAVAGQTEQDELNPAHRTFPAYASCSPHASPSSHPLADDGLTHFSWELRILGFLPFSPLLLIFPLLAIPGAEKDLLNQTQRRRE